MQTDHNMFYTEALCPLSRLIISSFPTLICLPSASRIHRLSTCPCESCSKLEATGLTNRDQEKQKEEKRSRGKRGGGNVGGKGKGKLLPGCIYFLDIIFLKKLLSIYSEMQCPYIYIHIYIHTQTHTHTHIWWGT